METHFSSHTTAPYQEGKPTLISGPVCEKGMLQLQAKYGLFIQGKMYALSLTSS
jgi:hypothetical protein